MAWAERDTTQLIRFGRAICGHVDQAERREWWLANGIGGYAAGTVAGSLTRRYHGLLIAPVVSALDRHLLMAKADAWLEIDGERWPLFSNRWQQGGVQPAGCKTIETFYLDGGLPVWVFAIGAVRIEQRIWMERDAHASWVGFRLLSAPEPMTDVRLHLHLLSNCRNHHSQTESGSLDPRIESGAHSSLSVAYNESACLCLQSTQQQIEPCHNWIENFLLTREAERGLASIDNHLEVAWVTLELRDERQQGIRIGLKPVPVLDLSAALDGVRDVQKRFLAKAVKQRSTPTPEWIQQLMLSAQCFLFKRPLADGSRGESIIAGYPWFSDWGRDAMIALPGLTLVTGQYHSARKILETYARYIDQGMIPNRFPEAGEQPEYNTVDAALWYLLAWHSYIEATGDLDTLAKVMPALAEIIEYYVRGTRYDIHMDAQDGLIYAGEAGSQLTWMDAKVGETVFTPRIGKPVEINALWYSALQVMHTFSERLNLDGDRYGELAVRVHQGFQRYRRDKAGLSDLLDTPQGGDDSVRPNQLFAISLPWPLVDETQAKAILSVVRQQLHTSYGIRSLAPDDRAYQGNYRGGVRERDSAYHQGTVWAWLLGHYAIAHYQVYKDPAQALALIEPMRDHLTDAGLGSISEIFDGDAPHEPRGIPAQAWSVATILQAWWHITQGEQ